MRAKLGESPGCRRKQGRRAPHCVSLNCRALVIKMTAETVAVLRASFVHASSRLILQHRTLLLPPVYRRGVEMQMSRLKDFLPVFSAVSFLESTSCATPSRPGWDQVAPEIPLHVSTLWLYTPGCKSVKNPSESSELSTGLFSDASQLMMGVF